ncbi:hypothetical protein [Cellulomonas dongxiuzhuiae]|uniref:hypothetical protein n=1 Tax=Cellulomonas dongxiuzhuiae TaxID=2819979 RepID=UPI001AAE2DF0|nr:hypothetical protein [Cellulomonas dongxiuzhuiae]MBO3088617.1 hypothetical protein [Cellulomonas dongxiuzhuiae]MBO3094049.1 hypothetical protein [Cellulomonas dongxiuzhuiae]
MEINTIVKPSWRHEYTRVLAPTGGTFQGIAVPMSGRTRRPRPVTFGTDLGHRTP